MKNFIGLLFIVVLVTGCASSSVDSSGNPLNRSLLIDTGIKLGGTLPVIQLPLPDIDLGFRLNFRRPTNSEEVDLNLSKLGKWKGQELPAPPPASPKPFSATTDK